MSKYELAVVVSAKLEDDARAEVIEKVKALVTRFGGNITDVDEWVRKERSFTSSTRRQIISFRPKPSA